MASRIAVGGWLIPDHVHHLFNDHAPPCYLCLDPFNHWCHGPVVIGAEAPLGSSVNIAAPVTQPLTKTFSIYGTPSIVGTGVFTYTVQTQAPSPGCETAISTGTITVEESASINIINNNPTGQSFCGSEQFNGATAICF